MGRSLNGKVWVLAWVLMLAFAGVSARAAVQVEVGVQGAGAVGSTASPVVVPDYVEITFPNGTGSQTVPKDQPGFYATARIRYQGNGPFTIRWWVDGRPIVVLTRTLTYGTSITVRSDETGVPLPTFEPGYHSVTLTLDNGTGRRTVISVPTIRYFVANPVAASPAIALLQPAAGSRTAPLDLAFRWRTDGVRPATKAGGAGAPVRYRLEVQTHPPGFPVRSGTGWREAGPLDGLADAWVPAVGAEVTEPSYRPPPAVAAALRGGAYRWRVTAFFASGGPVVSAWGAFELDDPPPAGGVFLRTVTVTPDAPVLAAGTVAGRTTRSLGLRTAATMTAGAPATVVVRVENASFEPRPGVVVELVERGSVWDRQYLSELPAAVYDAAGGRSSYLDVGLAWQAPTLAPGGELVVRVFRDGRELDRAVVAYAVEVDRQLGRFDFAEIPATDPEPRGLSTAPQACTVLFSTRTPLLCSRVTIEGRTGYDGEGTVYGVVTGYRSGAGRQGLDARGVLIAEVGVPGWFSGELTDDGYAAWMVDQSRRCADDMLALADYADQVAGRLETTAVRRPRDLPEPPVDYRCDGLRAAVDGVARGTLDAGERRELAARARTTAARIRESYERQRAFVGDRDRYPAANGFAMPLELRRVLPDGGTVQAAYLAGADVPRVWPGDEGRPVTVGPWTPERPGRYLASLGSFGPWAEVRVGFPGGLPGTLLMGGFELTVDGYDPGSTAGGPLSGTALLAWRGDGSGSPVPVRFSGVRTASTGDPIVARVTVGSAELDGAPVDLALGGHRFSLRRLSLDAQHASADLDLWYPLAGVRAAGDAPALIPLEGVEVVSGGEFVAERRFPDDYPDFHPAVRPGVYQPYADDLTLKLAGARVVADFSPRVGYAVLGGSDPSWQGVALAGGFVRVAIHTRDDLPFTRGLNEAATGLFDTLDPASAYLYGRFSRLDLTPDGRLSGEIDALSPAEAPAFFGTAPSPDPIRLQDPAGFALEIESGVFTVEGDGVGGLDLAGRVRLP